MSSKSIAVAVLAVLLPVVACSRAKSSNPTQDQKISFASALAASAHSGAEPSSPSRDSVLGSGRDLTARFYKGDVSSIWTRMTDEMHRALGTEPALVEFRKQMETQLGVETSVVDEKTSVANALQVYVRKANFSKSSAPVNIQWVLNAQEQIAGFRIQPAPP